MSSKRAREGYLCVDHRWSPGLTDDVAAAHDMLGFNRALYESAVARCNHCEAQVVLNPKRTRERGYCRRCDSYLCDACELERTRTLVCVPFEKKVEQMLKAAVQQAPEASVILLPD